jgi:SAM-dependent methyltransferase
VTPVPATLVIAVSRGTYACPVSSGIDPHTRWTEISSGHGGAAAYQKLFDDLEESGVDIHGEARFVASLVAPPARILDAGCGTGRVAIELTRLGFHCVGVDSDLDMIEHARRRGPGAHFVHQDLTELYLRSQAFDLAVLAGNVVPLLAPGTLNRALERLAAHVQPEGLLVAGFGLDAAHLPPNVQVTTLAAYDRACSAAGFSLAERYASWDRERFTEGAGYAVSVHRRG